MEIRNDCILGQHLISVPYFTIVSGLKRLETRLHIVSRAPSIGSFGVGWFPKSYERLGCSMGR